MNRVQALIFLALTALINPGQLFSAEPPAPGSRPNLLVILADDLGWSDLGCYGGEIHTPNLDALAARGLRGTQFYTGTRCCPSRACVLTGLYPHQAGIGLMTADRDASFSGSGDKGDAFPGYRGRLNDECVTLGETLGAAGYRTMAAGKWHVGVDPTARGFQSFYGFATGYGVDSWDPRQMVRLPGGEVPKFDGPFYATDAITSEAVRMLKNDGKNDDRPWLLYLAYQAPHFPLQAPVAAIERYVPVYEHGWDRIREQRLERQKKMGLVPADTVLPPRGRIPLPKVAEAHGSATKDGQNPPWDSLPADRRKDLARRMATFAAMVELMDAGIGRVLEHLRSTGELDRTAIFFMADNGACAEWDPFGFDLPPEVITKTPAPGRGVNRGTQAGPNKLHTGDDLAQMGQPGTFMSYGSAWANACNTPLRLYKHYGHEGGIRSPFIVHWPAGMGGRGDFEKRSEGEGEKMGGRLLTMPAHLMDLMPTCLDLAGASYPKEFNGHAILPMEGLSLKPWLSPAPPLPVSPSQSLPVSSSPSLPNSPSRVLAWEHEGNRALRSGDWKIVAIHDEPWQLFDLSKDMNELHDLAKEQSDRVKTLAAEWDAWAKRCHVLPRP